MKRIQLVGMQMMSRQPNPICRAWGNCDIGKSLYLRTSKALLRCQAFGCPYHLIVLRISLGLEIYLDFGAGTVAGTPFIHSHIWHLKP